VLKHSIRFALVAAFALLAACDAPISTPTTPSAQTVTPATLPGPSSQQVQGARVYVYASSPYQVYASSPYQAAAYTRASRFVLYENGTFALQYSSGSQTPEYRGTYTEGNGRVSFSWEGWSVAGPWAATGVLTGDSLAVTYNIIMSLSDFEDASYTLVR
jgi:hypothetical protein